MKKEKEEKLPNQGCDTKMSAEEKNKDVQQQKKAEDVESTLSLIEAWAPFLQKFIKVMIAIEDLVEAKKEMEGDPYFVHVMKKFIAFKEKYEAEHADELAKMGEVDDDYDCEDKELFDAVKNVRDNLQAHGISVKIRKVTDPEEVKKFDSFMKGVSQKNGASSIAEA
jgi:hypothetical protein